MVAPKAVRLRAAKKKLQEAFDQYRLGRYAEACAACEAALKLSPALADASYALGVLACIGGAPDVGALSLEHALAQSPNKPHYIAALADARLLQQREKEALNLYSHAFPDYAREIAGLSDAALPWKKSHPDWLKHLKNVAPPKLLTATNAEDVSSDNRASRTAAHLLNWALVLISERRVRQAIFLLERSVAADSGAGYGHAVLALVYTLNRDWQLALTAAAAARQQEAEVFAGATDLCLLSAQFGLGYSISALDPVLDWSAFNSTVQKNSDRLMQLPARAGDINPYFANGALVYFICCDTGYFLTYAISLVCSIREHETNGSIHLHVFNPEEAVWSAIRRLQDSIDPMALTFSWEYTDFDRYGGKSLYCACVRFARLYQLLSQVDNRIVMIDADSLILGEISSALLECTQIGLVRAPNEPVWHQYLAGFTTFRRCAAAHAFLSHLSGFIIDNLISGRGRIYLDQIGLYASVYQHRPSSNSITELPIETFCDTLFQSDALMWSVTQQKDHAVFNAYKSAVLARYRAVVDGK